MAQMLEQVQRGRAEQQEAACRGALAPGQIDLAAQDGKEAGRAMHSIKDDQLIPVLSEVQLRLGELGAVLPRLQVEVHRGAALSHLVRQGCLANLTRPEQGHGRIERQFLNQPGQ